MKRELGLLTGDVDVEAPRLKRRKEQANPAQAAEATNASNSTAKQEEGSNAGQVGLKEQATRLWQVVKDAVNKEGNICSPPFMRLPSKRNYADYYVVIAQPICLDDIKKKIEDNRYPSLDEVRQDFELCFTNAKRYNIKDSPIWLDAKFLLKVANKEYTKITGKKVKKGSDPDENGEETAEVEGDDDKKKNKPPNMNRLLKARLQKLVEKTDDETHRVLSDVFMEMPSKKDYPMYYKQIKRPICIENIFKRLKRKEYTTSEEFANDVELDHFRQLMSDLPPPYALPRYARPGKIKLKVPGTATISASQSVPQGESTASKPSQDQTITPAPLTLRLPAATSIVATKSPVRVSEPSLQVPSAAAVLAPVPTPMSTDTPASVPTPTTPSATPSATPAPAIAPLPAPSTAVPPPPPKATAPPTVAVPTPKVATQPPTYTPPAQYTHYPNAVYRQPTQPAVATPQLSTAVSTTPQVQQRVAHSVSRSPVPSLSGHQLLGEVLIFTKPRGRPFWLDHRDGVKSWAIRLSHGEQSLLVTNVKFLCDEDRDSSDEESRDLAEEGEEVEAPAVKKRGRGRNLKNPKNKAKVTGGKKADPVPKKVPVVTSAPLESIQVVLNGTPVTTKSGQGGWEMELQTGSNVLEVGEKGGHIWKVYLEKPTNCG
ncbi:hypothetical protein ID866_2017 [Astraeus odoratus]|nr:hypothetical protein ID866_2017 [Astraeus odoratus]